MQQQVAGHVNYSEIQHNKPNVIIYTPKVQKGQDSSLQFVQNQVSIRSRDMRSRNFVAIRDTNSKIYSAAAQRRKRAKILHTT